MFVDAGEETELREFLDAVDAAAPTASVAWALARFETGCARELESEALSDYLLALRALLDATSDTGRASLALRLAALCAEEGERRAVQRRIELTVSLEGFVMRGGRGDLQKVIGVESPRELVDELERHLRALLRDVLCGYLDADLKSVADDILLETREPFQIEARDLRPQQAPVTDELEAVQAAQPRARRMAEFRPAEEPTAPSPQPSEEAELEAAPEGVTPSADWGFDEDPESYSAPV
jgi:hypothetical protein